MNLYTTKFSEILGFQEFCASFLENSIIKNQKVLTKCIFCSDQSNHLILNLDWNTYKCVRCGASGHLVKFFKSSGNFEKVVNYIKSNLSLDSFTTKQYFKSQINVKSSSMDEEVKKYIDKKGLVNISKIKTARKYLESRFVGDTLESKSYLCDDKYIYIPLTEDHNIVAYLCRLYIEFPDLPKYIVDRIYDNKITFGYYDEVIDEFSVDCLYLCEGYFDAYAINFVNNKYVAMAILGKSINKNQIEKLKKSIPNATKVVLVLDSQKSSKNISKYVIENCDLLNKYFYNIQVCQLPKEDPNYILKNEGASILKSYLDMYTKSFLWYNLKESCKMTSGGKSVIKLCR